MHGAVNEGENGGTAVAEIGGGDRLTFSGRGLALGELGGDEGVGRTLDREFSHGVFRASGRWLGKWGDDCWDRSSENFMRLEGSRRRSVADRSEF